jgi:hypothetical protein
MQGLHLVAKRLVGVWKGRILGDTLIALFSLSGFWKISRKPIDKDHKEVAISYVCARKKVPASRFSILVCSVTFRPLVLSATVLMRQQTFRRPPCYAAKSFDSAPRRPAIQFTSIVEKGLPSTHPNMSCVALV